MFCTYIHDLHVFFFFIHTPGPNTYSKFFSSFQRTRIWWRTKYSRNGVGAVWGSLVHGVSLNDLYWCWIAVFYTDVTISKSRKKVVIWILKWEFVVFLKDVLWPNCGRPHHTTSELWVGSCSPRRLSVFSCKYVFQYLHEVSYEKRARENRLLLPVVGKRSPLNVLPRHKEQMISLMLGTVVSWGRDSM